MLNKYLGQSTILHEALHSLAHLGDGDLEVLLGLPNTASDGKPTDVINRTLEDNLCAAKVQN